VLPHSLALGLPDPFARRVARNTQLVLLDESNLAKVSDPAAGSGGIEALTGELCTAAWQLFQEIESTGGSLPALQQNLVQRKVAATRAARDTDLARRRQVLTGATEFPNLRETAIAVLQTRPVAAAPDETKTAFDPLPPMRLAAPFEALRDRSDAFAMQSGGRPKVFLANLGTAADFTARASFARSFFETGGIEAVEFLPSLPGSGEKAVAQGLGALATAFRTSGAALACLCSSDKVYALQAIAAAQALQEAGASRIYLAGRAGDHEAALRTAGVSEFVFAGSDALASLQNAWRLIEG
jgi:methylmalonyl-CoA mutase